VVTVKNDIGTPRSLILLMVVIAHIVLAALVDLFLAALVTPITYLILKHLILALSVLEHLILAALVTPITYLFLKHLILAALALESGILTRRSNDRKKRSWI
jgi:hypothetical protein